MGNDRGGSRHWWTLLSCTYVLRCHSVVYRTARQTRTVLQSLPFRGFYGNTSRDRRWRVVLDLGRTFVPVVLKTASRVVYTERSKSRNVIPSPPLHTLRHLSLRLSRFTYFIYISFTYKPSFPLYRETQKETILRKRT